MKTQNGSIQSPKNNWGAMEFTTPKICGGPMRRTYGSNFIGEIVWCLALVVAVCAALHSVAGGAW
jgi:hypothetical protein